ncbi:flavodoxin family protein [Propionispora hippei]|uniref:Multimeric flavodoxin WrbA n=1 Tax=Propionispora hippei DSM 15287 TaxID=1123003 RepID=A0A1M6H4A5_9FIRM|nr:flavodoxin family protein [Propionispora hippei]SHJ17003.1 Multimeric flavodoxin WrbA [Propionispora hippei DSM 15287]
MKVMAFVGSPRRNGNTDRIVRAICKGARESGHEVDLYHLAEMNNKGCIACDACQLAKVDFCSIDDELTTLMPKIAKADCLIVGTPIYMLQVSGVTKHFLDRLRPFLKPDLTAKHLPGKKYITVTCSGAPATAFSHVTEYLNQFFGYFRMESAGHIVAGSLHERDDIIRQSDILEEAEDMGKKIN